jgi:uncharacterized membrane protein YhiD involved in acid resistance
MQPNIFDALFVNSPSIYLFDVIINVLLACVLGFLIAVLYRLTYSGYSYSVSFVHTLILITMVTCLVIMVIGNNLARAFGLVGAMSIIRFRTAVKDTKDIAFVFFSLAAGMAAGAGGHMVGIVGSLLIGMTIIILYALNFGVSTSKEFLLRFWMQPSEEATPPYIPVFNKHLRSHVLVNMRSARLGQFLELSFHVRFKRDVHHQSLIRDLSMIEGIERISLIMGESQNEMSL